MLDGLLEFERATGGSAEVRTARRGGEEELVGVVPTNFFEVFPHRAQHNAAVRTCDRW